MRYQIRALSPDNQVIALDLDGASETAVRELAERHGNTVLSVGASGRFRANNLLRRKTFSTTLFSIELLALLDAGINLVEALRALCENASTSESWRTIEALLQSLNEGEPFSKALEKQPQHFPPLYVATVRSSERTGDLRDALARFIAYEEEFDRVRKKVIAATIYPMILVTVGSLVLMFLVFYVVPRFARVYDSVHASLPFFSRLLLRFGSFIDAHGIVALVLIALAVLAAIYALASESARVWLNERLWRIPSLGRRMKIYQLARLYRTVGMLLQAGIPVVRAMDMVSGLLTDHLRQALAGARRQLEEGKSMSAALGTAGLATPIALRMLSVGERSGQLGEMMARAARFYDDDTARYLDRFTKAFEPILMAVLGLAVGLVVVLMYMPIFELAGTFQ